MALLLPIGIQDFTDIRIGEWGYGAVEGLMRRLG